jgi:hypothetical protein
MGCIHVAQNKENNIKPSLTLATMNIMAHSPKFAPTKVIFITRNFFFLKFECFKIFHMFLIIFFLQCMNGGRQMLGTSKNEVKK